MEKLVSRARELAELNRAIAAHRLVTLHGPGGAGKTWLAREYAGFVVPVTTDLVIDKPDGLLVLDGAQQALDVCATLALEALSWSAAVRILVTSTEVLDVPGERSLLVTPFDETAMELTAAVPRDYQRLTGDERLLLHRLSVLTDEFDLDTAVRAGADERLAAQDVPHLLGRLVAKSMVLPAAPPLFRLLGATRAFAAVELAAAGETDRVLARLGTRQATAPVSLTARRDPQLTGRQHQVLELVAAGRTNLEIAAELGIAERTVGHHVANMLTRLGLRTRTQLAAWAGR